MQKVIKQVFILIIVFLILGVLIYGLWFIFLKPAASCSDNILNQGEEEVDCGGPCALSCEEKNLLNPEIKSVKFLKTTGKNIDLIAQIKNPNPNFGLNNFFYYFELYDEKGTLIEEISSQSFLLPSQSKYLIKIKVAPKQEVGEVKLKFGELDWLELKDNILQLPVKNKKFEILDNNFSRASGVIKNINNFNLDRIDIKIIIFNSAGEIIASTLTDVRTLMLNEERYFEVMWPWEIKDAARMEIEADSNLYEL